MRSGPSLISLAVRFSEAQPHDQKLEREVHEFLGRQTVPIPFTTVSQDAAKKLIPLGWKVDWLQESLDEPYWTCGLYRRSRENNRDIKRVSGSGKNAACAISCAAMWAHRERNPNEC